MLELRSLDGGRGLRAHATDDGCRAFAAGQLADGRPIRTAIAVQPEPPYRARRVIDAGAERAGVTRERGKRVQ